MKGVSRDCQVQVRGRYKSFTLNLCIGERNREIAQVNYSSNDALNQPADCAGNCDIIAQL